MADREFRSFEAFWDFYVSEHKSKANRILHFVGTTAAMGCVATAAITRKKRFLLAAPVVASRVLGTSSSRRRSRRASSTRSGPSAAT